MFSAVRAILENGVARSGVPVLSCISGYLLFSSGIAGSWGEILRRKSRTLILPLVLCNAVLLVALYIAQSRGVWTPMFPPVRPVSVLGLANKLLEVSGYHLNIPLYFLRDLFVSSLLAPVFGLFARRAPWLGLAVVVLVFGTDADSQLILRADIAINFYVGALAATRRWDLCSIDRYGPLLLAGFVAVAAWIGITTPGDPPLWLRLLAPWLVWPAAARLVETSVGQWLRSLSGSAFTLFFLHYPIFSVWWRLYRLINPVPGAYVLFWTVTPFLTAAVSLVLGRWVGLDRWRGNLTTSKRHVGTGAENPALAG